MQPLQGGGRESGDSLPVPRWHVGHVEPLLLPLLHRLDELAWQPLDAVKLADHGSSALCDLATVGLWFDTEQLEPEPEMGLNAEKRLAEDDVGGDVEDGVGRQMMKLEAIEVHEALEKRMNRKTQTSDEVGDEDDTLALPRFWNSGGGTNGSS